MVGNKIKIKTKTSKQPQRNLSSDLNASGQNQIIGNSFLPENFPVASVNESSIWSNKEIKI